MIAVELDAGQRRAIDAGLDAFVVISGEPGSGKTTALFERVARAAEAHPHADPLVADGRQRIDVWAAAILREAGFSVRLVDDVDAELLFETACAPLFELSWEEFAGAHLDPEVPGLRSPERFMESAFRLIRKLREAHVEPDAFLARALAGAAEFHAKPPNLAHPSLLYATKEIYRDSLDVTPQELQRQHRREVDLAKILARLYADYVALVESSGQMTGRDAIVAAERYVRERPAFAQALRERTRFAFVDRAEELTQADLDLLRAVFGDALHAVTLAGDAASAIGPAGLARPERLFELGDPHVVLQHQHRTPPAIDLACRRLANPAASVADAGIRPSLTLHRAQTPRDEAAYVAKRVRAWLDEGIAPDRIAILFRSVRNVERYESALLDRGVPVVAAGDANVFSDRRALDALALLWNVEDPFRHEWMLRTLEGAAVGLADASIATLCAEPPNPQTPLFTFDDEPAPTVRSSRWDPKRDLRLGWNVVRGEQDAALSPDARARVERFRRLREGWLDAMYRLPFEAFARRVWREGLAREGTADSARARAQAVVLQRLLTRFQTFFAERPQATIADALEYAQRRARSELESCEPEAGGFVQLLSIDAARGREFDCVVVADVRAGAFPRWYVPDTFLFSPRLGMIPRENAGSAKASRTAKFTYYVYRNGARERYNERERRALIYALRRARSRAIVTASEPPTRGAAAPELLEELRNARPAGCEID